jgi:hypothetical protein
VVAGICEAADPGWVMEGGAGRDAVYLLRLLCGVVLLGVSVQWFKSLAGSEAIGWNGEPARS